MINKDRIVPVTNVDLLTLIGCVYAIACDIKNTESVIPEYLTSEVPGHFDVYGNSYCLLNEPAKVINITGESANPTIIFTPAYDFEGFERNGETIEISDAARFDAEPKCIYKATLAGSAVMVEPLQLMLSL